MGDRIGKNEKSIKMLWVGLAILAVCLGVCIYMVSSLDKSYTKEVAADFQEHHESSTGVIDSMFFSVKDIVKNAVSEFSDASVFPKENEIYNILNMYEKLDRIYTVCFVNDYDYVFFEGNKISKDKITQDESINVYREGITKTQGEQSARFITADLGLGAGKRLYLFVEEPVYHNSFYKGYIVVTVDMTDFFANQAFEYQNSNGEAYIITKAGDVLMSSEDVSVSRVYKGQSDFFTALEEYSNGHDSVKNSIQSIKSKLGSKEMTYETLKTSDGYNLQVSFSAINAFPDMYFISCFNDSIVENKVQPLIFRTVLACIIIISLMVATIVVVWANAKSANITIERLAFMDYVTEGKNINYFKEFATASIASNKETPFVIYRFDILNFRYINEAYGHTKADGVLKVCIRSFEEVFSDKELCVRMNADQFLALVVNDRSVEQKLKQFNEKVNQDARGLGIKYPIKFKTGICQVKKHEHDIDVLIDHANVARKTLSGDEKEMRALYSEKIVNDMRKIDRIESEQQRALATDEFKVYLQPKWDIKENKVSGAEALVRWIKADGSMVYPDEFIPVFENNGFVEKLDFYMLEKVCAEMKQHLDAGHLIYPISVNQSRMLLHSPDYVKNVEKILKQYDIPKGFIELEITETVFENDRDNMIKTMNELKKIGIRLSMDDFGSGYSSLNMLKDIPFDVIKIDRGFFSESVTSEASLYILQKIVELAYGLGMQIICEGVETGEQVVILRSIGCIYVQGYYYSKPIPSDEYYLRYCGGNDVQ